MRARLLLRFPDAPARSVWVPDSEHVRIGRAADAEIRIDRPSISRHHAWLDRDGNQWTLRDGGSKNGTYVHDRRINEPVPLAAGDWLRVGDTYLQFSLVSEEAAAELNNGLDRQLSESVELRRALAPSLGVAGLVQGTLDAILDLSGYERGFVLMGEDGSWEVRASHGVDPDRLRSDRFSGSLSAVERCVASGRAVICNEIQPEHWLSSQPSVVDAGLQALICLPLAVEDDLLGVVYADKRQSGNVLSELDLSILESLTSHAALALAIARMDAAMARLGGKMESSAEDASAETPPALRLRR